MVAFRCEHLQNRAEHFVPRRGNGARNRNARVGIVLIGIIVGLAFVQFCDRQNHVFVLQTPHALVLHMKQAERCHQCRPRAELLGNPVLLAVSAFVGEIGLVEIGRFLIVIELQDLVHRVRQPLLGKVVLIEVILGLGQNADLAGGPVRVYVQVRA